MVKYQAKIQQSLKGFAQFKILHIVRWEDHQVDDLSNLVSSTQNCKISVIGDYETNKHRQWTSLCNTCWWLLHDPNFLVVSFHKIHKGLKSHKGQANFNERR